MACLPTRKAFAVFLVPNCQRPGCVDLQSIVLIYFHTSYPPHNDPMLCIQVFSIRAAATDNLAKLAQEFGADWAQEHLVPQACCVFLQAHHCHCELKSPKAIQRQHSVHGP